LSKGFYKCIICEVKDYRIFIIEKGIPYVNKRFLPLHKLYPKKMLVTVVVVIVIDIYDIG
jgi:hypothetical protein